MIIYLRLEVDYTKTSCTQSYRGKTLICLTLANPLIEDRRRSSMWAPLYAERLNRMFFVSNYFCI